MIMQLSQSVLIMLRHTSVAHPLFAECVQGLVPPQLVHATISLGPLASRFFSVYDGVKEANDRERLEKENNNKF